MNRNVLPGICSGIVFCAAGIVCSPPLPLGPEAGALFAGILGGLALLTVVGRDNSAATACRTTGIVMIGGYAIAAGVLSGPAALGALALMAGAALLIGRALLRGEAPGQRLPEGGST